MGEATGLWSYPVIFGALMAAGLGFPIPEEIPVVTAGALTAKAASRPPTDPPDWAAVLAMPGIAGDPALSAAVAVDWHGRETAPRPRRHPVWWIMLPVCIIGVIVCDTFLYAVGRIGGPHLVERRWFQFFFDPKRFAQIESNFHKYGVRLLLGVRLLPGIRAPVFVAAGIVKLPLHRFLLADGIYAIPVVSLLFFLSFWFTDSVVEVIHNFERQVGSVRHYFVIGGIAALAAWLVYEFWKRRQVTGDPKEVPLIGEKMIKPTHEDGVDPSKSTSRDHINIQTSDRPEGTVPVSGEKWSLKSYAAAAAVAIVVCWTVYRIAKRREKTN